MKLFNTAQAFAKELGTLDFVTEDFENYQNGIIEALVRLTKIDMPKEA